MEKLDVQSVVSGFVLAALGAGLGVYASLHYEIGTLNRMGSGMFPVALGFLLALLGLQIGIAGLFRGERTSLNVDFTTSGLVLGATALFALTVVPFGFVPATILLVVVSSFAGRRLRPWQILLLACALALLAVLIFRVALGLRLPILKFPGF